MIHFMIFCHNVTEPVCSQITCYDVLLYITPRQLLKMCEVFFVFFVGLINIRFGIANSLTVQDSENPGLA